MRKGLLLFSFCFCSFTFGQSTTEYHHLDRITVKIKPSKDSLKQILQAQNKLVQFQLAGYVGIECVDSVYKRNKRHYYYTADHQFKQIEFSQPDGQKRTVQSKNFMQITQAISDQLELLENNGYPFAALEVTEMVESDELLRINYKIDSGEAYIIHEIHLKSEDPFQEKIILTLLGLKAGMPYDESKIRRIPEILKNSQMYSSPRSPELLFKPGKAELFVYFNKKKSSNADGFVGFQQDRVTERLVLNGYVNLQLENALNRAEKIYLNWRNNPNATQNLKSQLELPYLFGTPLGIGAQMDLQKQDTSFVRSDILLELIYRTPQFRTSLYSQFESSSTISSIPITGFRDFRKNTIGTTFLYRPLLEESFYHPTFFVSGGIFRYRADSLENEPNTIGNRKYAIQYKHEIDFLNYFQLRNTIRYEGLQSTLSLSRNEYLFFGGLQSVRGFYELELAAKEAWILRNEVAFTPIDALSIKAIYDYANYVEQEKRWAHAIGAGFGFKTGNTELEIIIANGKLDENPFILSETKVHIGFRSNF